LPDPKAKVSAQYFTGRCLQELGRKLEAHAVFQALADAPESHAFQENSQLRLARLLVEGGHASEARPFLKLLAETSSEEIKAGVHHPGRAASARNGSQDSDARPRKALQTKGTDTWHGLLRIGILKSAFALGESEKVIAAYSGAEAALDTAQLPEIQLLVGNAHKQLKQYTEAAAMYSKLVESAPDSAPAASARYERLTCFYNLERKDLPQQIDAFLATKPEA
jgi:tetratricopeptide (TPR) repeat protein